ncbi:MAG: hypothetical protein N3B13_09465, partial [Deltaproteobacteria bacterium]|nr:hypothetical protein [Deltaproteobacteria bacterium]
MSSVYITSKYDLQNVIRDDKYSPQSTVYLYNKKTKSLIFLKGKELSDKYIHDFMQSNIEKIIYLEDGFGYILPQIIDKTL